MSETGPLELIDFLQHMPKVEIPCHLLGAIRRNTFLALRDQHQTPLSQAEGKPFMSEPKSLKACSISCAPWTNTSFSKRLISTG